MIKLDYNAYKSFIDLDVKKIKAEMSDSFERDHILKILEWSADELYKDEISDKKNETEKELLAEHNCLDRNCLIHRSKINCFPYGDNCSYDECQICGRQLNFRVD